MGGPTQTATYSGTFPITSSGMLLDTYGSSFNIPGAYVQNFSIGTLPASSDTITYSFVDGSGNVTNWNPIPNWDPDGNAVQETKELKEETLATIPPPDPNDMYRLEIPE